MKLNEEWNPLAASIEEDVPAVSPNTYSSKYWPTYWYHYTSNFIVVVVQEAEGFNSNTDTPNNLLVLLKTICLPAFHNLSIQ